MNIKYITTNTHILCLYSAVLSHYIVQHTICYHVVLLCIFLHSTASYLPGKTYFDKFIRINICIYPPKFYFNNTTLNGLFINIGELFVSSEKRTSTICH